MNYVITSLLFISIGNIYLTYRLIEEQKKIKFQLGSALVDLARILEALSLIKPSECFYKQSLTPDIVEHLPLATHDQINAHHKH